ncbi:helix-turn-helix transcriptional regulator [Heliorestis convoluta]|uniref:Transcriptional regulator PadR-like family protein n=1 Tax=Heliorestis convoluta TaxID=356322 RepID=A0A5Q2MZ75_9FIRM|nr:helix-turn-helix transcriptional regulator [Heliorestis convoluta]QGG46743.1 transcriptional regulator PadR-like family protein [Heliorestis convoluta]
MTYKEKDDKSNLAMYRASRNWLVPYLLLILRNWTLHGYDIMIRLAEFGINTVDHGTVYRTLRQLEKDGHVSSSWENSQSGPSRRIYSITDSGKALLDTWLETMTFYQGLVNNFIDFYQETVTGDFFGSRVRRKKEPQPKEREDNSTHGQKKDDI